jgi:hypothetical protein
MSHLRPINPAGPTAPTAPAALAAPAAIHLANPASTALEGQVQNALNLFLPLKSPAQMPALARLLIEAGPTIQTALASLRYVHFARFLPSPDNTHLMTITTYDGGLDAYTMDFVAVLGDVFTEVLRFIRGAPPLPVQRHAREFVAFVRAHNVPIGVWSAYPGLTVLDITHSRPA